MSEFQQVLNIITGREKGTGPLNLNKVFKNVCKGLDLLGQPYVINRNPRYYNWNWIYNSKYGFMEMAVLGKPALIGPNIAILPIELPQIRPKLNNCIYLQPCEWAAESWRVQGFTECPVHAWPVGIDCDSFKLNRNNVSANHVMIYFKARHPDLLDETLAIVKANNLVPHTIVYGKYNEDEYKEALATCSFGIWLGRHESQGIALQEALASGIPLIVIDAKSFFDAYGDEYQFPSSLKSFKVTSAPYFDERCGIIIDDVKELNKAIEELKSNLAHYKPREFVEQELSLQVSAQKLIDLFRLLPIENSESSKISVRKRNKPFIISAKARFYKEISKFVIHKSDSGIKYPVG